MGFLGKITSGITNAFKGVSSIVGNVAKAVTKVATPILNQAKDIFSAISKGAQFVGKLADFKLPLGLPNPLQPLSGLAQGVQFGSGGIGDVLKQLQQMLAGGTTANVGGQQVTVPQLADRGGAVAQASSAISNAVANGTYSGGVDAALQQAGLGKGGGLFDSGLSPTQQSMLNQIEDPKQRAQAALQMKMANQAEVAQLISNLMKMMSDTSKAIIGNIR